MKSIVVEVVLFSYKMIGGNLYLYFTLADLMLYFFLKEKKKMLYYSVKKNLILFFHRYY